MSESYSYQDTEEFADRIITSYLWCTEPKDMCQTVRALMKDAERFGFELDYERFGIISE